MTKPRMTLRLGCPSSRFMGVGVRFGTFAEIMCARHHVFLCDI